MWWLCSSSGIILQKNTLRRNWNCYLFVLVWYLIHSWKSCFSELQERVKIWFYENKNQIPTFLPSLTKILWNRHHSHIPHAKLNSNTAKHKEAASFYARIYQDKPFLPGFTLPNHKLTFSNCFQTGTTQPSHIPSQVRVSSTQDGPMELLQEAQEKQVPVKFSARNQP